MGASFDERDGATVNTFTGTVEGNNYQGTTAGVHAELTQHGHITNYIGKCFHYRSSEDEYTVLSSFKFTQRVNLLREKREENTGTWFFDRTEVTNWLEQPGKMLWCPGEAGAGKSMIAFMAVERVGKPNTETRNNIGVVWAFFDAQSPKADQIPRLVIGSLLQQLARQRKKIGSMATSVTELRDELEQKSFPLSVDRFVEPFKDLVKTFSRVFVVIDALDESPGYHQSDGDSTIRAEMKQTLEAIANIPTVSLMVTARNHITLDLAVQRNGPQDVMTVPISADPTDLRNYTLIRIRRESNLSSTLSMKSPQDIEKWHQKIVRVVTEAANGIFLVAQLYLDSIEKSVNLRALKSALEKPPTSLNGAYQLTMDRVKSQDKDSLAVANVVLPWIACALRPLTVRELQHALAIKPEKDEVDDDDLYPERTIISVCAGFVVPDGNNFRVPHATAKDYLISKLSEFPDARRTIATTCITYLSSSKFKEPPCQNDKALQVRLKENQFILYAACNWGYHLREFETENEQRPGPDSMDQTQNQNGFGLKRIAMNFWQYFVPRKTELPVTASEKLDERAMRILQDDNRLKNLTQIMYIPDFLQDGYFERYPSGFTSLHLAAHFGSYNLARRILEDMKIKKLGIDSKDSYQKTALHVAARKGDSRLAELLLKHGADTEATTGDGETPLLGAAALNEFSDNEVVKVVEVLIKHGANVMALNRPGGSGLHWASLNGNTNVVKVLLENGADFALVADAKKTVDYGAATVGNQIMITLLLDKLALAGIKNLLGGTPLHWAAFNGRLEVVKILLDRASKAALDETQSGQRVSKKAYVNSMNLLCGTPLHGAAWNGNEDLAEELLKQGADINVKNVLENTPLCEACLSGNEAVVKVFLRYGADVDLETGLISKDKSQMPRKEDQDKLATWLVARGVEADAGNKDDGEKTLEAVIRRIEVDPDKANEAAGLLRFGIIFRTNDEESYAALRAASSNGFEALTRLLRSIKKTPH